ncbi:Uncharacterized protein HSRCO_2284 [Halanaeroarchaeum sp. HSR-CO]|uniref:DUF7553 family protein n=1 Tax=Halanaeroarchaeum sp. HSR-CO TaxID=2866382 RepID=UPI00217D0191|nr:hypothetical protein [Halanaeroarchaeum sp. HSR-CO]UWG48552.1 Uncharacterized protein HSRCO_2284 [Halanaeroarchaeum sp. HSR-CO]
MNKHFEDSRYYLGRAVETAARGVREELDPVEERVRAMIGREKEPEAGRLQTVQADLLNLERRAEGEAREAIGTARRQISGFRSAQ